MTNRMTKTDWPLRKSLTPSDISASAIRQRERCGVAPVTALPGIDLLLIDMQNDFSHPDGALYVSGRSGTGALEDVQRVADFMHINVGAIANVWATLDTHVPGQVFFTSFWTDGKGNEPGPFTVVTLDDLRDGRYLPSPAAVAAVPAEHRERGVDPEQWVRSQVEFYLTRLAAEGRYSLILWPYHCLLGSEGHSLAAPIREAALYHSLVRGAPFVPVMKGMEPWTESYSVFNNEVDRDVSGTPLTNKPGLRLADRLIWRENARAVVVAGEAASHCVKSSIDDLLIHGTSRDPSFPERVYVMSDCMSSVVTRDADGRIIPDLDFTEASRAAISRWKDAGVNVVESTAPMTEWPGMAEILRMDAPQPRI